MICRGSNNYGPYQYPEKLIPLMILNALHGDPLPVYGDGHAGTQLDPRERLRQRRSGTCSSTASAGEVYNAGGPDEEANIEVVRAHHRADRAPASRRSSTSPTAPATTAATRSPPSKVRALGWAPAVRFAEGLEQTVAWYRENAWWWEPIRSGDYREYYERQYGRPLRPETPRRAAPRRAALR